MVDGRELNRKGIYVCIHTPDSLHCTTETNATLESNYVCVHVLNHFSHV